MAGLLDLFSGRSSDIYGQGLLTPEQRGGLGNIGLLALAGKLGQLAGPSFSPVPDFGAALGQAAGAYGASQEGAGTAALNAILTGQKGRKLEQELDYYKQLGPVLARAAQGWPGADGGGTAATPETGSTGGGAAAPLGAGAVGGGTGGWGPHAETAADVFRKAGWSEAAIQGALANGLAEGGFSDPWRKAGGGENSYGHWQLNAGGELPGFQKFAGGSTDTAQQAAYVVQRLNQIAPGYGQIQDPKAATDIFATKFERYAGAAPGQRYGQLATVQQKLGAAPTAAAPAGGGGLLAPNPLSDAEPMLPSVRPRVAPQAAAGPQAAGADLLAAGMSPEMVARYLARPAPGAGAAPAAVAPALSRPGVSPEDTANQILRGWTAGAPTPGQGTSEEPPPGFAGRQLVAQLLARPPIDDLSQYRQVAGPGAADAAATPRAPLPTMGPAGIELPPMQGPLAAPASAAAAPAAPGPGLLSPPGALPAAPALPRTNPAFDAYARNLAVAAGLAKGAGLPDALGPLLEMFKGSPAYKAQQIIAEKTAAQPFEQAQTLFNKQVEIAGVGQIEAAKLPYALAQAYFKAEQDIRTAGPVAAAQNFERIRADNAAKGIITTKDADGNIKIAIDPDVVKAVTGATITAPKQAEADIGRETTRLQQEQASRYQPVPGGVPVMGADGKTTMMPMSQYEYDLRQRLQAERRGTGTPSSGPQPGDIVGTPYVSKEEEQSREIDLKTLESKRVAAESAKLAIQNANDSRDLVEKGVVMGPGESVRSGLLKLGYALKLTGKDENDLIANTEAFISRQGAELKDALKGLGPPISNIDVQTAGSIAGGKNVTVQGYLELMKIKEKYNRQALSEYNDMAAQAPPGRFDRTVKEPPAYGAKTATGPNGQRMWEKSPGNWVAF